MDRQILIEDNQVRKKFDSHKKDFRIIADEKLGITDNQNRENFELFKDKVIEHMVDPNTKARNGRYRTHIDLIYFYNEKTDIDVMIHLENHTYLSRWKLSEK